MHLVSLIIVILFFVLSNDTTTKLRMLGLFFGPIIYVILITRIDAIMAHLFYPHYIEGDTPWFAVGMIIASPFIVLYVLYKLFTKWI
jgi:hypothetical protein